MTAYLGEIKVTQQDECQGTKKRKVAGPLRFQVCSGQADPPHAYRITYHLAVWH